jgi:hypothetical protein
MLLLAALPAIGFSQTATKAEGQVAQEIAQCLVQGPPEDWERLYMIIELPEPGAPAGRVRYVAEGKAWAQQVAYVPCDAKKPAQLLMDARENQSAERRGWTGARLVIHRSGRFDLNYDYPR